MTFEENKTQNASEEVALKDLFGIDDENLFNIVDLAKDFAFFKGICMRPLDMSYDARVPIPFCLVPSTFPGQWFSFVKSIQQDMNFVLHQISYSPKFLSSCLESVLKVDEFTAQIFKIYKTVCEEGVSQPLSLGMVRCDYMLDTDSTGTVTGIKQIENNTISISFCGLSPHVRSLHEFILMRLGLKDLEDKLPKNRADFDMAKGLVSAWDAYGNEEAVVLFVVEDITTNICDQRALELTMYEVKKQIKVERYTFKELRKSASLQDKRLFVDGKEVAVVYYRSGYVPVQYEPEDWEVRLLMERSLAIKCPTAGYHLAGTKTVQMQLSMPGVLEKFLPENSDADRMRQAFAKQFSMNMGEEGDAAVALALKNPDHYVLKPEREGGGYNIYGNDIKTLLESTGSSESRQAYILMEKINPPHVPNCIIRRSSQPKIGNVICELGVYGVILGTQDKIHVNYEAGHLIRSKEVGTDEGGIVAGFGALDSPFLV